VVKENATCFYGWLILKFLVPFIIGFTMWILGMALLFLAGHKLKKLFEIVVVGIGG